MPDGSLLIGEMVNMRMKLQIIPSEAREKPDDSLLIAEMVKCQMVRC